MIIPVLVIVTIFAIKIVETTMVPSSIVILMEMELELIIKVATMVVIEVDTILKMTLSTDKKHMAITMITLMKLMR